MNGADDDHNGTTIHRLTVPASAAGTRLDAFLAASLTDMSRTRLKALILDSQVSVGDSPVLEPRRPVAEGEAIAVSVPPPLPASPQPEAIPLAIVYEDDDLIVIDKPAGLVVHPAAGNQTGTLVNALIAYAGPSLAGIGGVLRPGIVHRLDKDTTGLMVVAKTERAHKSLSAQFKAHVAPLERAYKALVWGAPATPAGTIDAPLGRSSSNREKIAIVRSGGREAVTHYRTLSRYPAAARKPAAALIECRLETGRTHQIRVHMASIGHPLIGDRTYGAGFATKAAPLPEPVRDTISRFARQALHAYLLGFAHPATGRTMRFESPLPEDMQSLVAALKSL